MVAPAAWFSRSTTSLMVVLARTARAAAAASAKMPSASAPRRPSGSSTPSRTVTSPGSRAKAEAPLTPRWERRMPARRRTAKSCSRNWTGTSRRRASSPIGTGPAPPQRASSASARIAYGDLVVIESTTPILTPRAAGIPRRLGSHATVLPRRGHREGGRAAVAVAIDRAHAEEEVVRRHSLERVVGDVADRDRVGPARLVGVAPDDLVALQVGLGVGVPA